MKAGYTVTVSASGDPDDIRLLTEIVIPGATPMRAADAARAADLVVLAVPLHKFRTLPADALAGKTVIDSMNYWAPVDGSIDEFDEDPRSTSEVVQEFLAAAQVVKSLNHIGYHELEADDRPVGSADRRALGLAGDECCGQSDRRRVHRTSRLRQHRCGGVGQLGGTSTPEPRFSRAGTVRPSSRRSSPTWPGHPLLTISRIRVG